MARFDNNLGMWRSNDGNVFASKSEAEAHDRGVGRQTTDQSISDEDAMSYYANEEENRQALQTDIPDEIKNQRRPKVTDRREGESEADYLRRMAQWNASTNEEAKADMRRDTREGNIFRLNWAAQHPEEFKTSFWGKLPMLGLGLISGGAVGGAIGGAINSYQEGQAREGHQRHQAWTQRAAADVNEREAARQADIDARNAAHKEYNAPVYQIDSVLTKEEDRISRVQSDRKEAADDTIARYEALVDEGLNTDAADQARRDQQEGLAMQRRLFEKQLDFDPAGYANTFSEQALARQIAAARSSAGGAAARQFAELSALDQAPELYAEGQRQADSLELQRMQAAGETAGKFGELATGTRGQDEDRAVTEADLGFRAADNIAKVTGLDMQLSSAEAIELGKVALAVQKYEIDWASLSEQEAARELEAILTREGYANARSIAKLQGKVGSKDVVGGLFSVIGTVGGAALGSYLS